MGAIGSVTYNNFIGDIRLHLKQFTPEKYPKLKMQAAIYRQICELYEISGTKDDAIFRASQVIPLTKGVTSGGDASTPVTYTASTRTLHVPLVDGDITWANDTDGFDSSWVGATVSLIDPNTSAKFQTTIESITGTTDVVLTAMSPAPGNMAGDGFSISITLAGGLSTIDISNIPDYKFINRITAIEDSVTGLCVEMPEKDFRAIKNYVADENPYKDEVIWYRHGNIIYMCKNSIANYGTRTMYYTRFPIKPTTYTECVDYPDTQNKLLLDAVTIAILIALKVDIPQDLQGAANKIQAMRESTNENILKANANGKTQ